MTSKTISIKNKLTLLLMGVGITSLLITSLLFYHLVSRHFQVTYQHDLQSLAEIVGQNCKAALLFDIPEDAKAVLGFLRSRKSISQATLHDKDGVIFASYQGAASHKPKYSPPWGIENKPLKVSQEIHLADDSLVGYITVIDDMRNVTNSKKKVLFILVVVGLVVLLATFFLSSLLQSIISQPLTSLTVLVRQLAGGNFNLQESQFKHKHDELGLLYTAFKDMSRKLQRSNARQEEYSRNLEQRVYDRTAELQTAIHNLTKSQSQLVQSEKMAALGQLVAGIAHEINNNISFIAAAIPVISYRTNQLTKNGQSKGKPANPKDRKQLAQEIHEMLGNAEEGIRRTKKIICDLNTFSQPSHGEFSHNNITEDINSTLALLNYRLKQGVEVKTDFHPDLPALFCLRDQMNQVYMNLLLNAIHAINGKGSIHIKAWISGSNLNISFADSGSGVDKAIQDKIFDPFFTTKAPGQGSGLGLSISYSIIANHEGRIKLCPQNCSLGGAEFVISVPNPPTSANTTKQTAQVEN